MTMTDGELRRPDDDMWAGVDLGPAPNPYPAGTNEHAKYDRRVAAEREALLVERRHQRQEEDTRRELDRLRARRDAEARLAVEEAEAARAAADNSARVHDGASFLLDLPATVPAIWGKGDDILWARGESLMLAGPQGVGKTTIAGQLLRASIGLPPFDVLGWPVESCDARVLYLAMDRPEQARRNLARMFNPEERDYLAEMLRFWVGPPPQDVALRPEVLLELALQHGADRVVLDSVKDAAIGVSKDEVGAGYNRARQLLLAEGIQLLELHHVVKNSAAGGPPNRLADIYGSTWLTSGAGSVVMLWGEAGDPVIDLLHLKQPMNEVGPLKVLHNRETGLAEVYHDEQTDVVALARRCPTGGLSATDAAVCLFGKDKPSKAEVEKARRRLDKFVTAGVLVVRSAGHGAGGRGAGDRWFPVAPPSWLSGGEDA